MKNMTSQAETKRLSEIQSKLEQEMMGEFRSPEYNLVHQVGIAWRNLPNEKEKSLGLVVKVSPDISDGELMLLPSQYEGERILYEKASVAEHCSC